MAHIWLISLMLTSSITCAVPLVTHGSFLASPTASTCNETALTDTAEAYLAAQKEGKLDTLTAVAAPGWTYMENNEVTDVAESILARLALELDHVRTIYDRVICASYSELVSASDPTHPYVIGTQIRLDASNSSIVSVDSIVSTTNSWLFDARKTLAHVREENWTTILPPSARSSRTIIQAAGDAYLDMWSNATADQAVPWGTPCTRLEGSAYTGRGRPDDSCRPGIPSNHRQAPNTHRRYVIDEAVGSVSIFCVWEHMMNAADSHEFRIEHGKLRYVHTMTVCGGRPCHL